LKIAPVGAGFLRRYERPSTIARCPIAPISASLINGSLSVEFVYDLGVGHGSGGAPTWTRANPKCGAIVCEFSNETGRRLKKSRFLGKRRRREALTASGGEPGNGKIRI
jgi:hypothetical protein